MSATTLNIFLASRPPKGAEHFLAVLFIEDDTDIEGTVTHHLALRFDQILLVGSVPGIETVASRYDLPWVNQQIQTREDALGVLNQVIAARPGHWIYWCYNAEYLFFPYSGARTVGDLATFMEEERRSHIFTYAIDLYAGDLYRHPTAFSRDDAYFDRSGYYAFQRFEGREPQDRQFDVFGGLAWRYEEFIPWERRRIDRISLFKAQSGLKMRSDLTLSDPEMNTVSCQWHHNLTAAVASFRVAKSLKRNPGSTYEIDTMMWRQSQRFDWTSDQLMEMGMIEPGQWF